MLKYDNNNNCLSYCNGSNWTNISCPIDGICGSANRSEYNSKNDLLEQELCIAGTPTAILDGPNLLFVGIIDRVWRCEGINGGTTDDCSTNNKKPGVCGSANGTTVSAAPISHLCFVGTASTVSGTGPWTWTCVGSNGGMTSPTCKAYKELSVDGACGSANGTRVSAAPTNNLCSAGTASSVSGSGPWSWTCVGSNGGRTVDCSATKRDDLVIVCENLYESRECK
ncbi:MAG: hypothetical protein LBD75_00795 [Candidatus Peribacteria bacterium]|jgi:hypothetical protein|nr:hypothetical protein [Candidatus Peribacteria bacterium]